MAAWSMLRVVSAGSVLMALVAAVARGQEVRGVLAPDLSSLPRITAVTPHGARTVPLIESFQIDPATGKPFAGENGWAILASMEAPIQELHKHWRATREDDGAGGGDFTAIYAPRADADAAGPARELLVKNAGDLIERYRAEGYFDKLDAIARSRRAVRSPQPAAMIEWIIPELGRSRNFTRANAARMTLARASRDWKEYAAAFEQSLALARVCASQTTLIDRLVGIAIVSLATGEARRHIAEGGFDGPTLDALAAAIDRQLPLPPMRLALEGERLMGLDTAEWVYRDAGDDLPRRMKQIASYSGGGGADGIAALAWGVATWEETNAAINHFADEAVRLSALPRHARLSDPFDTEAFAESLPRNQIIARLIVPSVRRAMDANDNYRAELAGTRLMLAVERHRAATGRLPAALGDLVPAFIAEVPVDPFDPAGGPLGYRLVADDPRGYLLYSVGADGEDNGGALSPEGAFAAFGGQDAGKGFDYVFNGPTRRR